MMRAPHFSRIKLPALALAASVGLAPAAALGHPATAGGSAGLVLCRPARPAALARSVGDGLVRPARSSFLAPARQAVFFSRPGDRCAWGAGRARG